MMKGMTGFMGDDMSNDGKAQKGKITNAVQELMTDKFILKPKAVRVQHAVLIHHNRVIQ